MPTKRVRIDLLRWVEWSLKNMGCKEPEIPKGIPGRGALQFLRWAQGNQDKFMLEFVTPLLKEKLAEKEEPKEPFSVPVAFGPARCHRT
jgi:hypothetical protein